MELLTPQDEAKLHQELVAIIQSIQQDDLKNKVVTPEDNLQRGAIRDHERSGSSGDVPGSVLYGARL
jgi:hypothetical protein